MDELEFEYDEEKNSRNRERHGIDFENAQKLWNTDHTLTPAREAAGEIRLFIVGRLEGKLYAAVFTMRGNVIRLISCRRADRRLQQIYETHRQRKNYDA